MQTESSRNLKDTGSKVTGNKPCKDVLGHFRQHGEYFTPPSSVCRHCQCMNGAQANCISIQCQKPKCKNYKQVPGKCCDYTCPREAISDTTTIAVVVTLSLMLFVILIAIVIVWRKMRQKKKFGTRLETISTSSEQETDIDSEIKKNSVPNNLRFQKFTKGSTSNSPCSSMHSPKSPHLALSKNNQDNNVTKTNECHHTSSSRSPGTVRHKRDDSLREAATRASAQHEVVVVCKANECCQHMTRKFEPPPPYSPPKDLAFV